MKRVMRLHPIILITFIVCIQFGYSSDELPSLIKKTKSAVVTVIGYDADNNQISQGSGFFINDLGHFITNYHVIDTAKRVDVKTLDQKYFSVTHIYGYNRRRDLVRLKVNVDGKDFSYLQISPDLPEVGDEILVIGSPFNYELTASNGIVSAIRELDTGVFIQITAPISSGSSGSPVINMKGIVVGIATMISNVGQNLNFVTPSHDVLSLENNPLIFRDWVLKSDTKSDSTTEGEHHKSIDSYKQAIHINPNYTSAHSGMGIAYAELGEYQKALDSYKQAIRIEPDHAYVHNNLGYAYAKLGKYQKSIDSYKHAIRINPDYAKAHHGLGYAYVKLGNDQKALDSYKQAIRIEPDHALAHFNLGLMYLINEDRGNALEQYKILMKLDKELANKLFNKIYE